MVDRGCFGCSKHVEVLKLRKEVAFLSDESVLNKKITQLSAKVDRLSVTNEKLYKENVELRKENLQLKKDNCQLIEDINDLETYKINSFKEVITARDATIEELKNKIMALEARINKDFENSSKPSSTDPNHKKIQNNREKTNRKPGGQPGHKGTYLKKKEPTSKVLLDTPKEVIDNGQDYVPTGKVITKQLVKAGFNVEVIEYEAVEYKNIKTGKKLHAAFPKDMVNDVTYDASVKAIASILHSHGNMSYDKVKEILCDLSNGMLDISKGTLANLEKEFSKKSKEEREKIIENMLNSDYIHIDGTTVRVNGKLEAILITTSPNGTILYQNEHKGYQGVEGTFIELYDKVLIHDGEATFFNYGKDHQGCLIHELRYLKGSMENEPELTWAGKMHDLLQKMIHEVNEAKRIGSTELPIETVKEFNKEYSSIINIGFNEYVGREKQLKYYNDGYNTLKRLNKRKSSYLYFLTHIDIPATNNEAELVARKAKMHTKQNGGCRNGEYAQYYCDTLSVIESNRLEGISRYQTLLNVFQK